MTARGIDVSSYQGVIDWTKAKAGLTFAVARCVTEINTIDTQFEANAKGIRAAGLIGGAYCFLSPGKGDAQGATFANEINKVGDRGLLLILDVEKSGGVLPSKADVAAWVGRVRNAFPLHPILIYGSPGVLPPLGELNPYGTWWQAAYPSSASGSWDTVYAAAGGDSAAAWTRDANGWTHCDLWQFASTGSVAGISGHVDFDASKHTPPYLQFLAGMVTTDADLASRLAAAEKVGAEAEWDRQFAKGGAKITPLPRP